MKQKQKENKLVPCKCCPNRTELSVCRNEALKANWDMIKKLRLPGQNEKKKDIK
jgi:hypothetical protein